MTDLLSHFASAAAHGRHAAARPEPSWSRPWRSHFQSELEPRFASATDLVDLERRQRVWERGSPDPSRLAVGAWR